MGNNKTTIPTVNNFKLLLYFAPILIVILWILNWFLVSKFAKDVAEGGQFGDRFGAATSLFGGITIILLLVTIHLQRQEIADGKKEFKEQNRTLKYQRFDNTFFNLITLHSQIVENLELKKEQFKNFGVLHLKNLKSITTIDDLKNAYEHNSLSYATLKFGDYISNFEIMIDFIFTNKKLSINRNKYLKIYFAQLQMTEKLVLYYHFNLTRLPKHRDDYKSILFIQLNAGNLFDPKHAAVLNGITTDESGKPIIQTNTSWPTFIK